MVFVFFGVRDQRAHYPIFRILIIAGILGVIKEETMRFNVKFTAAALIGAIIASWRGVGVCCTRRHCHYTAGGYLVCYKYSKRV